jgi:hypothetical protein
MFLTFDAQTDVISRRHPFIHIRVEGWGCICEH